jgi:hypothetical protein
MCLAHAIDILQEIVTKPVTTLRNGEQDDYVSL